MQTFSFRPQGVCSQGIQFSIDDNKKLHDIRFYGGCPGNLAAISKLLEGADAAQTVGLLKGNSCGGRPTSCADQLAVAVGLALEKMQ